MAFYQPAFGKIRPTYYIPILTVVIFLCEKIPIFDVLKTRIGVAIKGLFVIELYLFVSLRINGGENQYLVYPAHIAFALFFIYAVKRLAEKAGICESEFESIMVCVGYIQSTICVIMYIFPFFRVVHWKYLLSTLTNIEKKTLEGIPVFRFYGIAGANQYLSSIGTVSAVLFLLALYREIFRSNIHLIKLAKTVYLLIPAFLDAKTGVVLALVGCVVLCVSYYRINRKQTKIYKIFLQFGVVVICMLLSSFIVQKAGSIRSLHDERTGTSTNSQEATEYESSLWGTAGDFLKAVIANDTDSKVYEWYGGLLPSNWNVPQGSYFLIGEGEIHEETVMPGEMLGRSDSGFARLLCVGGLFLLLLQLSVLLCVMNVRHNTRRPLADALVVCFLLAEVKGNPYLQTAVVMSMISVVLWEERAPDINSF